MIRRVVEPLPALAAALLGLLLALLYIDHGWGPPVAVVAVLVAVNVAVFLIGRRLFAGAPYLGGLLMESGPLLFTWAAGVAGAVLVWLAIEKAPEEGASAREKEVFTAISAALTAYLGSLVIEQEGELWNPVRSAVEKDFGDSFRDRATPLEKDARDAVQLDNYGAQASEHRGHVVSGWGWSARRLRTRHIGDQLKA